VTDYALNLTLPDTNPERLRELAGIARGVTSIKMFMAYEAYQLNDVTIFRAMEIVAAHRGLAVLHAENFEIISEPARGAERRDGPRLAPRDQPFGDRGRGRASRHRVRQADRRAPAALPSELRGRRARDSRGEGARTGGVRRGVRRLSRVHERRLRRALERGYRSRSARPSGRRATRRPCGRRSPTARSTSSRATTVRIRVRRRGRPGVSSIETRLALVHHFGVRTGRLSPNRWVEVCCANPAAVFGLPRKGQLRPGYDADIVLFDPDKTITLTPETLHSAIDYCSYDGLSVTGYPVVTISRGEVIVEDGRFVGQPGRGRFITRGGDAS
jgi:dihydropyrimidinase